MLNRRQFAFGGVSLGISAALAAPALAGTKPKVVIVGGGPGGGSVLRALVAAAPEKLEITLIERQSVYSACFRSNLYLGGFQPFEAFQFSYDAVRKLPGVNLVNGTVQSVDRQGRAAVLSGGERLPYDVLVLSPGIELDYNSVPGWSKDAEERMPHSWKGGAQLRVLKRQLDAVPDGGLIVILAPPLPYRCPPGPYERASMMAHALKTAGKLNSRIVILDAKESFSKQAVFQEGWERHYPGMIEWLPPSIHSGIKSVSPETMAVETGFETYERAALVNVIPGQMAGEIARTAGLAKDKGFCPIDPFTMKAQDDPAIFVLGDACIPGDMPKSAYAANSQAQVVARIVREELLDEPRGHIEYNNTCWSAIDSGDSVKIGGTYIPTAQKIAVTGSFISKPNEPPQSREANFEDSDIWYSTLTRDLFA